MAAPSMDKLVALCKGRGFIFAGSEIYGGLANTWDYGPLGVEFKNNVKRAWWQKFVQESPYNVGVDCAILMNREVWVASGHVGSFNDPLIDCKACKSRYRADQAHRGLGGRRGSQMVGATKSSKRTSRSTTSPARSCGKSDFTAIRKFNLMFKTFQGVTEDSQNEIYLRPETAQGIFVNFKNVAAHHAQEACPSASHRSANPSATRSRPATSPSAPASSSRWSWSSSASPATDLEWFEYWQRLLPRLAAEPGHDGGSPASARPRPRKSWLSIPRRRPTLNTCSRSAGASCGAWRTAPIMTSSSIRSTPASRWNTSTP